jgi:hypothetical protein
MQVKGQELPMHDPRGKVQGHEEGLLQIYGI